MSQHNQSPHSVQDDRLAKFTDQALAGKAVQTEANTDEELLALEETVLRLKNAFPSADLDQAAIKQMNVRLKARLKKQGGQEPFWRKWLTPQPGRMLTASFAAAVLLIVFAILTLPAIPAGAPASAAAMNPPTGAIIVTLTAVLLVLLWIKRRK